MSTFAELWITYGWAGVGAAAVLVSALFTGLSYAFGTAFRLREVVVWAREEFLQAMASALIFAYAVTVVALLSQFACTLAGKTGCSVGNDHMTVAKGIVGNLTANVTTQTNYIFQLNMRAAFISSLMKYYDFGWGPWTNVFTGQLAFGFMIGFWAGGSIVVESINYIFGIIIPILSSLIAQSFLLELIDKSLFPVLLAMGIILRTFFFSRKVGGLLIAIAIAIYTIYPLMYVLLQPFFVLNVHDFEVQTPDPLGNWKGCDASLVPFDMSIWGVVGFYTGVQPYTACNTMTPTYMFYTRDAAHNPGDDGSITFNRTVYGGMKTPFNGVLPTVGYMMIPGAFFPLLNILITISFIKVLSPTLGGDVEIAGLTRII